MKKTLSGVIACAAMVSGAATAAETKPSAAITRAGTQASMTGPEGFFTRLVRVDPLFPANSDINASGAYVTFEPSARSAWHTHPKGQYLVVTAGVGLTQEWGKSIQEIRPGDVVWCPPGVKHWHGAAPGVAMTHLAITGTTEDGENVQWLEKVSDEPYSAR